VSVNVSCNYYDPDGDLPVVKQLLFDRGVYEMGAFDHNYGDTATFNHLLAWPGDGEHVYAFRFYDGVTYIETPMDTINLNPDGIIEAPLPISIRLEQNYPNPFNAETKISFSMEKPGMANLIVYDIEGRIIATPVNEYMESGIHNVIWDGKNEAGQVATSGIYFYKLSVEQQGSQTRRMVLLK
jgi:hypothetical protein